MYHKGISKLLIAGLLLSGIQLPGTTGIAQADSKGLANLSASAGSTDAVQTAGYADMKQHWASAAVNRLSAAGILQGDREGQFRPGRAVTRAEIAVVINRMFRYTDAGHTIFSDVSASSWYGQDVSGVSAAGVIQGYADGRFQPGAAVTRQEVMTMLSRAFTLNAGSTLTAQSDAAAVSGYAREAVSAMLGAGYIRGNPDGKLNPQAQMTRAELAELLGRMVGWISSAEGSHSIGGVSGNVIVNRANVQLEGGAVSGNLYVTAGAGEGDVSFSGIKVQGTTHIVGGGGHSVVFRKAALGEVKLNNPKVPVRLVLEDGSTAARIELLEPSKVEIGTGSRAEAVVIGAGAAGSEIVNRGQIRLLENQAERVLLNSLALKAGETLRGLSGNGATPQAGATATPAPAIAGGGSAGGDTPTQAPATLVPTATSVATPTATPAATPVVTPPTQENPWELVWNDEFDGQAIDESKWNVQDTGTVYNNELEYYHPDNASLTTESGQSVLALEARKEAYGGKNYTSAKLTSKMKGDWTYGKFTVRAKLPVQQGMWPAIWMMPTDDEKQYGPWPGSGEMDIMELTGPVAGKKEADLYPRTVHGSIHYDIPHLSQTKTYVLPEGQTFADDYHEFTMEWLPGLIRYFVDDKMYFETRDWGTKANGQPDYYTYPAPFDRPFHMILNLAVGGDWPGDPAADFKSDEMYVDYVRVYKYTNLDQWPDVTGQRPTNPGLSTPQRPALPDGNQIYNGDFTGATAAEGLPEYWEWIENDGGSGTVSVTQDQEKGKAVKVAIGKPGTQNYSIQLTQKPLLLEKDKAYKVTFDAKADAARPLMSKLTEFGGGWTAYSGERNFQLTPDWKSYEYSFTMPKASDNNVRFEFNLGLNDIAAYFANVRVVETEAPPVVRTPLADGNLIYNGGFELGEGRLGYWNFAVKEGTEAAAKASVTNTLALPMMKREFQADVQKAGGSPEDVMLTQTGIPVSAAGVYQLAFDARSDQAQPLGIKLENSGGQTVYPDGATFSLTPEWKSYTAEIALSGGSGTEAVLSFLLGGAPGQTGIDNVRLIRMIDPPVFTNYLHLRGDQYWRSSGTGLIPSGEGGKDITDMDEGDYVEYKVVLPQAARIVPVTRVSSVHTDSELTLSVLDAGKQSVVTASVYSTAIGDTGGLQAYRAIVSQPLELPAGSYYIRLGGSGYNLAWLDLTRELVLNGSFKGDSTEDWTLYKRDWDSNPVKNTVMNAVYGALRVDLGGTGDDDWNVQVKQGGIPVEQGKKYLLRFDADASISREIRVLVQRDGSLDGNWTPYTNEKVSLSEAGGHYEYLFTAPASDSAAVLQFSLGKVTELLGEHTVRLSNISLLQVSPVMAGEAYGENLIPNGDFSSASLKGWSSFSSDSGELSIDNVNGALKIKVGSTGTNTWDRQVFYEGVAYNEGNHYTLTFKAKADLKRKMNISIGWLDVANNYTWHGYTSKIVDLDTEYTEYTLEFDVAGDSTSIGRISFELGNIKDGGTGQLAVDIDDIVLMNNGTVPAP
ncbi:carbohydrate binding domain-containing protein [Paenibacillus tritici]|uniref:carbohydrate binding domain-containing protein n=1 Tax=Paenibacillus tritici TaxID=1873425 RepID=UPI001BACE1AA|nr:carbohydrate binding domain-containing protein [Paenibacillus tritici]QUL53694.1 carbohydrate binding domain-containing protein [Paenibacillus tritici]